MRLPRLYTDKVLVPESRVQLQGQAGHYLSRVLRRGPGDRVILFNGDGKQYQAAIRDSHRGTVIVEVLRCEEASRESPLQLHLGLVMSKGDRMDWALQKATELGVSGFTPLSSKFCDIRLNSQRLEKKRQHWQQVAISACEQCGRNEPPVVQPATELMQWLQTPTEGLRLMFDVSGNNLRQWALETPKNVVLLVGPEGGFSDAELDHATAAGFRIAALGPRIMRTETVPVAAIALAQYLWGDL